MTVIGISGCTALLLAGFGIKDSISTIASKQFGEIIQYDSQVSIDKEATLTDKEDLFDKYTIVRSAPFFLEFLNKNANKGTALEALCNTINIPLSK